MVDAPRNLASALYAAAADAEKNERAVVALTSTVFAAFLQIDTQDLREVSYDRRTANGRQIAHGRALAISFLHTGLGWTQSAAAEAFGVQRKAASKAIRLASDIRDQDPALDRWMEDLERAVRGHFDGAAA